MSDARQHDPRSPTEGLRVDARASAGQWTTIRDPYDTECPHSPDQEVNETLAAEVLRLRERVQRLVIHTEGLERRLALRKRAFARWNRKKNASVEALATKAAQWDAARPVIAAMKERGPYRKGPMNNHFCRWCGTIENADPPHARWCSWPILAALDTLSSDDG